MGKYVLKKEGVHIIYTQNETKANYAERVIRTMKNMMYRYFLKNRTYRYVDVLQDLVTSYNKRTHRSLGKRAPATVTKENADEVRLISYLSTKKKNPIVNKSKLEKTNKSLIKKKRTKHIYKYKIGDDVRISQLKHPFQRDYQQKWTEEYFKVSNRYKRDGIPVYKIKDLAEDPIEGTFYESELQKVVKSGDILYRVEKVLKKRKRGNSKEVYVKWDGWPSKFNSWIPESSLEKNE